MMHPAPCTLHQIQIYLPRSTLTRTHENEALRLQTRKREGCRPGNGKVADQDTTASKHEVHTKSLHTHTERKIFVIDHSNLHTHTFFMHPPNASAWRAESVDVRRNIRRTACGEEENILTHRKIVQMHQCAFHICYNRVIREFVSHIL